MATRKAKPAGQFYCKSQDDIDIIFFNQAVDTLPGVGYSIRNKLNEMVKTEKIKRRVKAKLTTYRESQ
jgi:hypothetical protein